MAFIPFSIFVIIYVFIGIYVTYDNKRMRGLENIFQYKHNIGNAYVEYRQWKILWGLTIDSQKEINRIIDEWNDNGFTCIGFQRNYLPNVPIIKLFGIIFITIVTLGFVNFYAGPTLLFVNSNTLNISQQKI